MNNWSNKDIYTFKGIYNRVVKAIYLINKLRLIFRLIIKVESIYIKYIRNIYSYISNPSFTNSLDYIADW